MCSYSQVLFCSTLTDVQQRNDYFSRTNSFERLVFVDLVKKLPNPCEHDVQLLYEIYDLHSYAVVYSILLGFLPVSAGK
jgi:hypothetical protein